MGKNIIWSQTLSAAVENPFVVCRKSFLANMSFVVVNTRSE